MAERKYWAQILIEPEQHEVLAEKAHREGQSISHVVREIVAQYLTTQEQELLEQRMAFERLRQLRVKIRSRVAQTPLRIDVNQLIEEAREERADELISHLEDDRC